MAENRYCAFCDQKVVPIAEAERTWGKGEEGGGFRHFSNSDQGVPFCGRMRLDESQTYTMEDVTNPQVEEA